MTLSTIYPVLAIAVVLLAVILRLVPHRLAPHGAGVDHWFWKAYVERYRQTGKFPPHLPQFLLDEQQWYPPLFPLLIARLPTRFFERYSHYLAVGIDLARMILLMVGTYLITGRGNSTVAAGVVYALAPILISYNTQLNPRGLGAFFLDAIMLLLIAILWHAGSPWLWVAVVLLAGLVLLTHKMTTQLFWFCCLAEGLITQDWRLIALVPGSMASAWLLSGGFYSKVLRAHWDIVTFWNRNWRWLTVHPVRESPIYGEPGYETPTRHFRSGWKGLIRRMQYLVGFNPWAWMGLFAAYWAYGPDTRLTGEDVWVARWLALTVSWVLLTSLVPALRCLGAGYLYVYNSTFPAALTVGIIWGGLKHDWVINLVLAGTVVACMAGIGYYLNTLRTSRTLKVDADLERALQRLKELPEGVVMCFPQHWHDVVAYRAEKPVLAGGHGYGFRRIENIFPRIKRPIGELIAEHDVSYVLTFEGYLPQPFLDEMPCEEVESFGTYRILRLAAGASRRTSEATTRSSGETRSAGDDFEHPTCAHPTSGPRSSE